VAEEHFSAGSSGARRRTIEEFGRESDVDPGSTSVTSVTPGLGGCLKIGKRLVYRGHRLLCRDLLNPRKAILTFFMTAGGIQKGRLPCATLEVLIRGRGSSLNSTLDQRGGLGKRQPRGDALELCPYLVLLLPDRMK
jgi:hypothetical protein